MSKLWAGFAPQCPELKLRPPGAGWLKGWPPEDSQHQQTAPRAVGSNQSASREGGVVQEATWSPQSLCPHQEDEIGRGHSEAPCPRILGAAWPQCPVQAEISARRGTVATSP